MSPRVPVGERALEPCARSLVPGGRPVDERVELPAKGAEVEGGSGSHRLSIIPGANGMFMGRSDYFRATRGPCRLTGRLSVPTMVSMRRALAVVLACATGAVCVATGAVGSASTRPLSERLARALAVPHVSAARSAAFALDLTTGEAVFSRNSSLSLVPASNEKLATTYAALELLGADFRIETDVLGQGELTGTTWRGSLVLQGHGDPTLDGTDLSWLARQVRAAGIRRVEGPVLGDESFFDSRRTAPG